MTEPSKSQQNVPVKPGTSQSHAFRLISRARILAVAGCCLALLVGLAIGWPEIQALLNEPRIPKHVLVEDFQRPLDRDLMVQLHKIDETRASQFIDINFLKPLLDDVTTIKFTVASIEITENQFSDRKELFRITEDCAKILGIKKPRVFVADLPGLNAFAANMADPIIVLHSSLLRREFSATDLRYIIGHEMGHIACRHVKWLTVIDLARKRLPENIAAVALLPLLKWTREAEMSADNAGLICCQNEKAIETTMVKMVLNVPNSNVGRINVDEFIMQRNREKMSIVSEAVQLWREITTDHPFTPDRIVQLREYAKSDRYKNLMKN